MTKLVIICSISLIKDVDSEIAETLLLNCRVSVFTFNSTNLGALMKFRTSLLVPAAVAAVALVNPASAATVDISGSVNANLSGYTNGSVVILTVVSIQQMAVRLLSAESTLILLNLAEAAPA
jgi:hypothetical protein